ncbi:MAG: ATP-binding protein [Sulfuritalea sp.]|nr:ATP-binding protein [Sulfuritalea sp.]
MCVSFNILPTDAPAAELRRRPAARSGDASEANIAVLDKQLTWFEPLDEEERSCVIAT